MLRPGLWHRILGHWFGRADLRVERTRFKGCEVLMIYCYDCGMRWPGAHAVYCDHCGKKPA